MPNSPARNPAVPLPLRSAGSPELAARCLQQPVIQRFHCDGRLTTEIQGGTRLEHPPARRPVAGATKSSRSKRDRHVTGDRSATLGANALDATGPQSPRLFALMAIIRRSNRLLSLRGFNGEQPDPLTGHYHLGNGYRQFNPVLMRFNSPDSWSPFGEGGLNAYGYCEGDPVNLVDRNGHAPFWVRFFTRLNQDNKTFHIPRPQLAHNSKKLISTNQSTCWRPKFNRPQTQRFHQRRRS